MSSKPVKDWRKKTKDRMILAMGGRCRLCGYDRCPWALEFHHLDPAEKDFTIAGVRVNPKSWDSLVEELRKCVMLCANCHREVHAGAQAIADSTSSFNEAYANYRLLERKVKVTKVKVPRYNIDWSNLEELKLTNSNVQVAKILGVSETAVRKRLKKLEACPSGLRKQT